MVLSWDAAKLDTAAPPDTTPGLPDSDRLLLFPWTWTSFYPSKPAGNGASCISPWQPCLCLPFPGNSLEKVHWPWMAQIAKMLLPAQCCPPPRQPHSGRSPFHRSPSMHLPEKRANIAQVGQDWAILLPSLLDARIIGLYYQTQFQITDNLRTFTLALEGGHLFGWRNQQGDAGGRLQLTHNDWIQTSVCPGPNPHVYLCLGKLLTKPALASAAWNLEICPRARRQMQLISIRTNGRQKRPLFLPLEESSAYTVNQSNSSVYVTRERDGKRIQLGERRNNLGNWPRK